MTQRTQKGDSADMATHETFILADLLPLVVGHAKAEGHPTEMVALACFLSLSTILLRKGIPREALIQGIDASNAPSSPPAEPQFPFERLVRFEEPYFHQFSNLVLAAMAYNSTDDAYDDLTHTSNLHIPDDIARNIATAISNANTALGVLVARMSDGAMGGMGDIVALISNPNGESVH